MLTKLKKTIPPSHPLRLYYHKLWAMLAAFWYGFPAKDMIVVGVTGTDGKTTTSTMTHGVLQAAGFKTGLASTLEFAIGEEKFKNITHKTTLGRFGLQKWLSKMKKAGCTHCVIEVSSHALSQHRTWGIPFDIAVITNVSPEHLDYHGSMEEYKKAKAILFHRLMTSKVKKGVQKTSIIYFDDQELFQDYAQIASEKTIGFGVNEGADVRAIDSKLADDSSSFTLVANDQKEEMKLSIPGDFNILNALAAAAVGLSLGTSIEDIKKGLANVKLVAGRLEKIQCGQEFTVILDFAMTADAYSQLITSVRSQTNGKVWIVFGCCGDRDKYKRPVIGEIVGKMCDKVIITDDEPYTENPESIIHDIESGIQKTEMEKDQDYFIIHDRKEAFRYATTHAGPDDTIIIPGMGDLEGRTIGTKVEPWSDREVLKELLTK